MIACHNPLAAFWEYHWLADSVGIRRFSDPDTDHQIRGVADCPGGRFGQTLALLGCHRAGDLKIIGVSQGLPAEGFITEHIVNQVSQLGIGHRFGGRGLHIPMDTELVVDFTGSRPA